MISNNIFLITQGVYNRLNEQSSVPLGVFVIIGVIALLVTLAFILSPKGSRRRNRRNSIFRK